MFQTIINALKDKDIRKKILLTLMFVAIYRLCCFIPVPGLDPDNFTVNEFFGLLSSITGGALANGTLFAMGIVPYINASIIMQLLAVAIPYLQRLSERGEEGRKKLANITRWATIILAVIQAVGIVLSWRSEGAIIPINITSTVQLPEWLTIIFIVMIFTAGTTFAMWIGERITDYGVGNGISLLIFVGIISTAANALYTAIVNSFKDVTLIANIAGFLLLTIALFMLIIFIDLAERKIPVNYAKQIKGRKMYGGQTQIIPIKVNSSGVLPIIFAFALLTFPQLIASFWPNGKFYAFWAQWFGTGSVIYYIVSVVLIIFFSFFYASIQFKPDEISKSIQSQGGSIPGIRQGKPTTDYLTRINNRLTLFGAIFLAFIATVPTFLFILVAGSSGLSSAFTATGLLIVVSVAMEINTALETQLTMRNYKGFLKNMK